ncbi:hypothetical protein KCP73_07410 [Salmonella enterica subsp. enterica]|nr:hypothetical protein KCP73_07410 [Salmonella enterica subsp. enterica]
MKPGEAIEHLWATKVIANAQRKVESRNFDIRKRKRWNMMMWRTISRALIPSVNCWMCLT